MYTFQDKGGDWVTLRPEATASIARAYIEHRLWVQDPEARLYFIGPMFRYERPQRGRLRQFHQIDAEIFGPDHPMVDAEIMALLMEILERIGLREMRLELNSLGCRNCRGTFRDELRAFLRGHLTELCPDCQRRSEQNPLRTFDCKVPGCIEVMKKAPILEDFLCDACRSHFEEVKANLEYLGVAFMVNPRLVRGLDYYSRTAFEVVVEGLGAQNAVAAGGRYDNLIAELGGPDIPGIGFAIGMERVMLLISQQPPRPKARLYVAVLGEEARRLGFLWSWHLKRHGVPVMLEYQDKSLKAQLRRANKLNIPFVLILGEDEIAQKRALLKDMQKGTQQQVPFDQALQILYEVLNP
ncbi:MAG: histidine--tRNA ligase, partial [Deltaproteobacteria bacterium]